MIQYILKNYSPKEFFTSLTDEYLWSLLKHLPGIEGILLRRFYMKVFSSRCGQGVVFERNVFVRCSSSLLLGDDVFINRDVHLAALGGLQIGNNVAIGPKVVIITNDHKFMTVGTNYRSREFVKKQVKNGFLIQIGLKMGIETMIFLIY